MKYGFAIALFFLLSIPVLHAQSGIENLRTAIGNLCDDLTELIPIISMLMIIAAGVIYAAGQIMGAETRARATTWASAMLIGAIIGILIVTVAPSILTAMYGCDINCGTGATWGTPCP